MQDRAIPEMAENGILADGSNWRRKVSPFGVTTYVTRIKRLKAPKVDWNRCITCGGRFIYRPGAGRFCSPRCHTAFDRGAAPYDVAQPEALAA